MLIFRKKKGPSSEFCKFSMHFVWHTRVTRREPQLSMVFGGKQSRKKKNTETRKISEQKCRKKFCTFRTFFALIGNTWGQQPFALVGQRTKKERSSPKIQTLFRTNRWRTSKKKGLYQKFRPFFGQIDGEDQKKVFARNSSLFSAELMVKNKNKM